MKMVNAYIHPCSLLPSAPCLFIPQSNQKYYTRTHMNIHTCAHYQLYATRSMLIYTARQGTFGECGLAKITEGKSWGKQAEALCVAKAAGSKAERKRMNPTTQQWNRQLA